MMVYMQALKTFMPTIVGVGTWKNFYLRRPISEWTTISDEAFLVISLYNNWNRWNDMRRNNSRQSEVPSKYTMKVTKSGVVHLNSKNKGWSNEGITHFNSLVRIIKDARENNKNRKKFELEWMQHWEADLKRLDTTNNTHFPSNEAFVELGNTNANNHMMGDRVENHVDMFLNHDFGFDDCDDLEEEDGDNEADNVDIVAV